MGGNPFKDDLLEKLVGKNVTWLAAGWLINQFIAIDVKENDE
jgi:hypothetical protein